ncbi:glycosyltransferase family 39 protein, partial [Candidatus Woesearchaeota archaeon]|nr:glycosyltransferase family 39 protein [Candidatus Woesearchaeota archaeon]
MLQKNNKITYGLFLILTVLFFIIVFKGLKTPQPGDENAYYYMGKLISEGKQPYKDFFFAHPPLQVYLTAFIFLIFGFNIIVLKLIPLISTIVSGFVIFKISRHKFGNYEALVSILLFFFSYGVIFSSVFSFGIEIATMFMLVGIYYLLNKEKYFIAGLFFALAGTTRLLSLVPIFVIFATILVLNKKKFIKLLLGFLIIF